MRKSKRNWRIPLACANIDAAARNPIELLNVFF